MDRHHSNTPDIGESWADWSPDGSKIVFASETELEYPGRDAVFIMNADGSGRANLSNYPGADGP